MGKRKDFLGLRGISGSEIIEILSAARGMKRGVLDSARRGGGFEGIAAATLFYEDSTRTRMSFTVAAQYLGMKVSDLGVGASSVSKGEDLIATGKNIDAMGVNIMVIRHRLTGAAHLLAGNVKASVINGGDGANEHPTQALLDLYTIWDYKGGFKGLNVAIIGDITHSRVARSNVFGLTALGARVTLAGPPTMVNGAMEGFGEGVRVTSDVKGAVKGADAVMGLRIQAERRKAAAFPDLREYSRFFGIDGETIGYARPDALIMHPGPVNRGVEMTPEVIDHGRSVILEQAQNGVAVRMALLSMLAEGGL